MAVKGYVGPAKREANFGPGSISTQAKANLAKMEAAKQARAKAPGLLATIMAPRKSPGSDQAAAVDRIRQEQILKKEIGGRR